MQILVMATGPFAVPSFIRLIQSEHQIVALVTMPLRSRPGYKTIVPPMRLAAEDLGIPIFDPPNVNSPDSVEILKSFPADIYFVCDFGQILSLEVLRIPRLGGINLHGSLLPKYRGAAPINRAILNGDPSTGVSMIHMTPQVDAGPVIAQSPPIPIYPHETAIDAEQRLSNVGSWLLMKVMDQLTSGRVKAVPQMPHLVSKAPKLKKEDGAIPWHRSALQIIDHYRATQPWPRAFTYWHRAEGGGNSEPLRLILGPYELPKKSIPFIERRLGGDRRRGEQSGNGESGIEIKRRLDENYDFELACEQLVHMTNIQDIANEMIAEGLMTEGELIYKPREDRRGRGAPPPEIIAADPNRPNPGTVLEAAGDRLVIASGNGELRVLKVQPAGKKQMTVEEFMRGYPVKPGDVFGDSGENSA